MKGKRVLAILTSMILSVGTLSVGAYATTAEPVEVANPCAEGHDYAGEEVSPTCTEAGYIIYTCTRCGDSYTDQGGKALGHDYAATEVVKPTCTEGGYTVYTCKRCGESQTDDYVDALGHDYVVTEEGKPTCTEDGYRVLTCRRCGDSYEEAGKAASGHEYKKEVVEPTCTKDGYTVYTCSRCGNSYTDDYVAALGHDFSGEGKVTRAATETAEGERTWTCARKGCNEKMTEAIPKLDKKGATAPAQQVTEEKSGEEKAAEDGKKSGTEEAFPLAIGENTVTKEKGELKAGKGTIKFEIKKNEDAKKETVKLELKDAELSTAEANLSVLSYSGQGTVTISFEGMNNLTGALYGIYAPQATVVFSGEEEKDTLTFTAASTGGYAILAKKIEFEKPFELIGPENSETKDLEDNNSRITYQTFVVPGEGSDSVSPSAVIGVPQYAVTFNAGEGASGSMDPETAYKGKEYKLPECKFEAPAENFEFDQWQIGEDADHTYDAGDKVELIGDTVVTALWKESIIEVPEEEKESEEAKLAEDGNGTGNTTTTENTTNGNTTTGNTTTGQNSSSDYDLWIQGEGVTAGNFKDVLGDGKISFDSETHTLTLKNVSIELAQSGTSQTTASAIILYEGQNQLNIVLEGDVVLTNKLENGYAIEVTNSSLRIAGTKADSLTASATGNNGTAIFARKTITIDGGTVKATGVKNAVKSSEEKISINKGTTEVLLKTQADASSQSAGSTPAVWASKDFEVGDELKLVEPEEGRFSSQDKTVVDKAGSPAATVHVLPEHVHEWDTVEYTWNDSNTKATASRTCKTKGCEYNTTPQTETVDTTSKETKKATCTEDGKTTYTATFKTEGFETQEKTEKIPATGHTWSKVTYTWASNNSTCTAKRTCSVCKEEETEAAKAAKTTTATCTEAGKNKYTTAAYKNTEFAKQTKEEDQAALGHVWGEPSFTWTDNNSKATATFTCSRDSDHKETVTAKVTGSMTIPGKTTNGTVTYTATATHDGKDYTDTQKTEVKPAGTTGYKFTVNPGSWTKNTKTGYSVTVKRNEYDVITFSAFNSVTFDGKTVNNNNNASYTKEKGSLKLTFKPAYMNTLAAGTHTLKIDFKDGSVETKVTVKGTSSTTNRTGITNSTTRRTTTTTNSPRTGDTSNWALWIGLAAASIIGIGAILVFRKRGKKD